MSECNVQPHPTLGQSPKEVYIVHVQVRYGVTLSDPILLRTSKDRLGRGVAEWGRRLGEAFRPLTGA